MSSETSDPAGVAAPRKEGWAWPSNSRKAHYFVAGRSLCRKWALFMAEIDGSQDMGENPLPDDCAACWRAAKKRQGAG